MSKIPDKYLLNKSGEIYKLCTNGVGYTNPCGYFNTIWDRYKGRTENDDRSISGRIFEIIVMECLLQEGIQDFYYQSKIPWVLKNPQDFLFYHSRKLTILECKTCIRDRIGIVENEAMKISRVYNQSRYYILTADSKEAIKYNKEISEGDISGVDYIIDVSSEQFNQMISKLKDFNWEQCKPILPIQGGSFLFHDIPKDGEIPY